MQSVAAAQDVSLLPASLAYYAAEMEQSAENHKATKDQF